MTVSGHLDPFKTLASDDTRTCRAEGDARTSFYFLTIRTLWCVVRSDGQNFFRTATKNMPHTRICGPAYETTIKVI